MSEKEGMKLFSAKHSDYGTENTHARDSETKELNSKLPFPKATFFIIANEFCERFCFYGMRAILVLYLRNVLKYSEDSATVIYHIFIMLSYSTPLFGAMIADSLLGKFRTIFYLSIVYATGNLVLSAATIPPLSLPPIPFSMIGLSLIALGTGGIKPCVAAFGGDQFRLPEQENQLQNFFSVFYFAINSGSLISTLITPIFRQDVSCFGDLTCYPLAFGVPAALMVTALTIFMLGKPFYVIREPEGNLVIEVGRCMGHAISNRKKYGKVPNHWLDCADDEYDTQFIEDIKTLLRILILYIPLLIFWSLFEQQGSRWTLQATRMNGRVLGGWTIKPDQMQVANSLLVLVFIPVFETVLYPLFARCNLLKKPLQRITVGGILAAFAFVLSGVVELHLEPTYPVVPGISETSLSFVNTLPCSVNVSLDVDLSVPLGFNSDHYQGPNTLLPNENFLYNSIHVNNYSVKISPSNISDRCLINGEEISLEKKINFDAESAKAYSILIIWSEDKKIELSYSEEGVDLSKSLEGNSKLTIMFDGLPPENLTVALHPEKLQDIDVKINLSAFEAATSTMEIQSDRYDVLLLSNNNENAEEGIMSSIQLGVISLQSGGSYLLSISPNYTSTRSTPNISNDKTIDNPIVNLYTLTPPNSVNMLWLFPQYVVITLAEILFSVTGYNFSYTQAPKSMRSIIQSLWLLTNAGGSLIVIIVTQLRIFERQAMEFFLFAGLMFTAALIFIILARRFKPMETYNEFTESTELMIGKKIKNSQEAKSHKSSNTNYQNFE